jgi:hypothetical protein
MIQSAILTVRCLGQVGKRAALWVNDLLIDLKNLQRVRDDLR